MSVVKSFSVGNGDMFYIKHASSNFTIIDCKLDDMSREEIVSELLQEQKEKQITRFISTHPDEDHIHGLKLLDKHNLVSNFYCVKNEAIEENETEDFSHYCKLRDGDKHYYVVKGCKRKWLNQCDKNDGIGCAGIDFLWPIETDENFKKAQILARNGVAYNNLSPIFTYSLEDGIKIMWMGDMEHDFLEKIKDKVEWPLIDVLIAPHHGRDSGKVSEDILRKLNPQVIIIGEAPSEFLNYYSGYNTITQNRAGDIVFDCDTNITHVFVENKNYRTQTNFLINKFISDKKYGYYLGSFMTKRG